MFRLFVDILRCIVAAFLAVFLIAALVVHAPWKITLLIGMMFANLTIIPRFVRKYIDLAIAIVFIIMLVWVFYPETSSSDWRPYTFDEELAKLEAARGTVPEKNAADIYLGLFAEHNAATFDQVLKEEDRHGETLRGLWSDDDFGEPAKWLDENETAIQTLLEAGEHKDCRFVIPVDNIQLDEKLLQLNLIKRWAEILVRSAHRDLAGGRLDDAVKKIRTLRRMASHLYRQQTIFDYPAALHIDVIAAGASARLIVECDPSEEHLSGIEGSLAEITDTFNDDWPMIFEWEKLFAKNIAGLFYEINADGRIRHSRRSIPTFDKQFDMGLWAFRRLRQTPRFSALVLCLALPRSPLKVADVIDSAFDHHYEMINSNPDNAEMQQQHIDPRLRLNYKGFIELAAAGRSTCFFHPLHTKSLEKINWKRATQILIALKRHKDKNGNWPDSLDELQASLPEQALVDAVNNSSFAYRRNGADFILYSKGKNGIDDNGRYNSRLEMDDVAIWPAKNRDSDSNMQTETPH